MYPAEDIQPEHSLGTTQGYINRLDAARHTHSIVCQRLRCEEDVAESGILPLAFEHAGTAFGYLLSEHFTYQTVGESHSFQHFCLTDDRFAGYFILSQQADESKKVWFEQFCRLENKTSVNSMCQMMVSAVIRLIEESLDAKKRSHEASIESYVLSFVQEGGVDRLIQENALECFDCNMCAVILFDFLKDKVYRLWLPNAIRLYRNSLPPRRKDNSATTPNPTGPAVTVQQEDYRAAFGTEENVNWFVGWATWSVTKRYKSRLQRYISKKDTEVCIQAKIDMLNDMTVLESDILGDSDYITRYYPLDDAIRNKGSLTLISPCYIRQLSKFSRYIANKLSLANVKKHAKSGTVKNDLLSSMVKDDMIRLLDEIVDISRTQQLCLSRKTRREVLMEVFEKMSNAKIGRVIRQYRSDYLTRKNDTSHRTKLSVLSNSSNFD